MRAKLHNILTHIGLSHTGLTILCALTLLSQTATSCKDDVAGEEPPTYSDEHYFLTSTDTVVTGACNETGYFYALLTGKINVGRLNDLPQGSTWGMVLSTQNKEPQHGTDMVVQCRQKSKIYVTTVPNLQMGTRYYYRAYLQEGIGPKIWQGKTMYFTTPQCDIYADAATGITPFSARVGGWSNIDLTDTRWKGESGIVLTKRQTDRPNTDVDEIIQTPLLEGDSIRFGTQLTGLLPATQYVFAAYVKIGDTYYMSAPQKFTTEQLNAEDSEEPVDMGLSKRWASRNVGAAGAEQAGIYFAWADPTGEMESTDLTQYPNQSTIVGTEYDMATANMTTSNEGKWMMPSYDDMRELKEKCEWNWTTYKGAQGYAVTSRQTGRTIFLPAQGFAQVNRDGRQIVGNGNNPIGYYWTGTQVPSFSNYAHSLYIAQGIVDVNNRHNPRYNGYCVRAVMHY